MMKNSGLRITVDVLREDGSQAQTIMFDQRGLEYVQLLELQQKAVQPCAAAIMEIMARWGKDAEAKARASIPTS